MRLILAVASMLSVSLLATPARATPPGCPEGTQADLTQCTGRQADEAEAEMDALIKQILGKVDADGKARLEDSQRAWFVYRDKECVFRTGGGIMAEGSIRPMLVNECERDVTLERIDTLRKQLDCPGGDLSC